jgi:hypothetical protein
LRNSSAQVTSHKSAFTPVQRAATTEEPASASGGGILDTLTVYGEAAAQTIGEIVSWAGALFGGSSPAAAGTEGGSEEEEPGKAALDKGIAAGIRDEVKLTDLVFHARHPELGGKSIGKDQTGLINEWKQIRETEVKPALAKPAAPAPGGGRRTREQEQERR